MSRPEAAEIALPASSGRDQSAARPRRGAPAFADRLALAVLERAMRRMSSGRLVVRLPSGEASALTGRARGEVSADVTIVRRGMVLRALRRGALGIAESYMDGDWETDDLKSMFQLYLANEPGEATALRRLFRPRRPDRALHAGNANTRAGSRRNIAAHYDLGNDFYGLWLDDSLTYSSALYADAASTLDAAQEEKYRRILDGLDLRCGHSLLEIGCGWGGLAERAARRGAQVDAITLSTRQLLSARARIATCGLADRVSLELRDYRDTAGQYDRVASVEMIEAVGEENWATYFDTLSRRLNPGGLGVIQAITIAPQHFERYRANADFIQRYIFPGGMLPTVAAMERHAHAAGLTFETLVTFGDSYALTLREWRARFQGNWPKIAALGFDERFRRMWDYYLAYCEAGFESGRIDVGLYRLRKD